MFTISIGVYLHYKHSCYCIRYHLSIQRVVFSCVRCLRCKGPQILHRDIS